MRGAAAGSASRGRHGLRRPFAGALAWIGLLGLSGPASAQLVTDPGTVIQTIDASLWSPPAPDTAGITYRPDIGQLLTCDSEVDEMTIFAGVNLWTHSNTGVVSSTATTTGYSNEPTGIAWDPAGGRLWVSDDDQAVIFEIDFGPDGVWGGRDDSLQDLDAYGDAGCDDLEDVAYDNLAGHLYISSGASQEVCKIDPGPDGVFNGAAPTGDDIVTTFSVAAFGILDPEGIVYDPFWNTLVLADRKTRDLYELTPEGDLLRKIDVNFPSGTKPSGVTIAPGSTNPFLRNYWVTDRRVDNGGDPDENDGRIYEVVAIPLGGNGPPIVDAGSPQLIRWPANSVELAGFVSDDGHPYPPSFVATLWSKQSGPGTVTFESESSPVTTATFSAPGTYELQLEGDDSLDQTVDTVAITVSEIVTLAVTTVGPGSVTLNPPGGSYTFGQTVTVTAVPGADAGFTGWSGDLGGMELSQPIVMNGDKSVTAGFATLFDVALQSTGPGSVTLDPPGGTYPAGTVVTVTATPGANAVFDGFGGALSGTASPQLLTVDSDKTISASFTQHYTLSVTTSGPGSVTLSPSGGSYAAGTLVTLIAVPTANAVFSGWGGALGGSANPETLTISADTAVSATFTQHYTVSTAATGPGSVTLSPPSGPYPPGATVTVTATPHAEAVFLGWSGDLSGTTNPESLVVDGDKSVTATFATLYDVTLQTTGPGSLTLDPPGGTYPAGTSVTITAVPDPDSAFTGWSGDLTGVTNPQVVVLSGDVSVTASFATLFDMSVTADGPGSVTLDPPGGTYPAGTIVSVTATPGPNAVFDGFGGDLTGTASPQLLIVDADKTISASFTQHYAVSVATTGPGSVTLDPPNGPYAPGTVVEVSATPGPNAVFDGFGGDLAGTASPQLLTVDADKSVSASFTQLYTVSVGTVGPGSVALSEPGPYAFGAILTVTASPDADAAFLGWSGDLAGTTNPESLVVDGDKSVTATFATLYDVTLQTTGPGSLTLDRPGGTYPAGSVVSVTATPGPKAVFDGYGGDLSGTANPQLLTVDGDKTVSATFTQHYTVSVTTTGPGSVTLEPPNGPYAPGTVVEVTATPGTNAVFDGFGGDLAGTASPQLLIVDADKTISASFTQHYTVSLSTTGPGSVTLDPPTGPYASGTVVEVTATPGPNAVFDGFTGDLTGSASPQLLTADADKSVTASFTPTYALTLTTTGSGSVSVDPPTGPYRAGTELTLNAVPSGSAIFDGWSGDLTGSANPETLVMDADKSVTATFRNSGGGGSSGCGIGPELAALMPALGWLYRRRRRS